MNTKKGWVVIKEGQMIFVKADWCSEEFGAGTVFTSKEDAEAYAKWTNFNNLEIVEVEIKCIKLKKNWLFK